MIAGILFLERFNLKIGFGHSPSSYLHAPIWLETITFASSLLLILILSFSSAVFSLNFLSRSRLVASKD